MPDRIVRVGILTSEPVNEVSFGAEVFYRRLMSIVDDFGRYDGRISVLRAQLYALQIERVKESDILGWLEECDRVGLVMKYEAGGKPFVEIAKFGQRIRSQTSKWPDPPDTRGQMSADDGNGVQPLTNAPVVVCVDVVEDVAVSGAGAVTSTELSIAFRKAGVNTQPADPRLIALAEQGITPQTVEAACAEAKRSKPNESVGLGYVVKILERWAKEAAALKAKGASQPKKQEAWWVSDASILAKGTELGLQPNRGESMQAFKGRIQTALDNPPKSQSPPQAIVIADGPKQLKPEGIGPLKDLMKARQA